MAKDGRDSDMPLSSFGGSSREWGEASVTFGMDDDDCNDSVDFKSTPVLRESKASPAFQAVYKENVGVAYDTSSPRARA